MEVEFLFHYGAFVSSAISILIVIDIIFLSVDVMLFVLTKICVSCIQASDLSVFGSAPETSTTVLVKGVTLRGKAAGRKNRAGSKQLRPVSSIKSVDRSSADDDVIKTGGKKVQRMRDDLVVDPFGSKRMKGTVYLFRIECVFKLFYINFFHCS